MSRKRWWRSPAGHLLRPPTSSDGADYVGRSPKRFSREGGYKSVPACKTPWRKFYLSRAKNFVNGDKYSFTIKLSMCEQKL